MENQGYFIDTMDHLRFDNCSVIRVLPLMIFEIRTDLVPELRFMYRNLILAEIHGYIKPG